MFPILDVVPARYLILSAAVEDQLMSLNPLSSPDLSPLADQGRCFRWPIVWRLDLWLVVVVEGMFQDRDGCECERRRILGAFQPGPDLPRIARTGQVGIEQGREVLRLHISTNTTWYVRTHEHTNTRRETTQPRTKNQKRRKDIQSRPSLPNKKRKSLPKPNPSLAVSCPPLLRVADRMWKSRIPT